MISASRLGPACGGGLAGAFGGGLLAFLAAGTFLDRALAFATGGTYSSSDAPEYKSDWFDRRRRTRLVVGLELEVDVDRCVESVEGAGTVVWDG